jgi:hypothetical protein
MKKPKLILSNRTPPILREIQRSIDEGNPKKEGNVSIVNIKKVYTVKKGKETVHQGSNFRVAYSFFLRLVIDGK